MKNVQISKELFLALLHYHLDGEDEYADEIVQGLEQKLEAMLRRDLMKFQETYAAHTGQKTTALALPYGAGNENTRSVAKELGFRAVFTCEERVNRLTGKEDELLRLGRFNRPTGESSAAFFGKKFQGAV